MSGQIETIRPSESQGKSGPVAPLTVVLGPFLPKESDARFATFRGYGRRGLGKAGSWVLPHLLDEEDKNLSCPDIDVDAVLDSDKHHLLEDPNGVVVTYTRLGKEWSSLSPADLKSIENVHHDLCPRLGDLPADQVQAEALSRLTDRARSLFPGVMAVEPEEAVRTLRILGELLQPGTQHPIVLKSPELVQRNHERRKAKVAERKQSIIPFWSATGAAADEAGGALEDFLIINCEEGDLVRHGKSLVKLLKALGRPLDIWITTPIQSLAPIAHIINAMDIKPALRGMIYCTLPPHWDSNRVLEWAADNNLSESTGAGHVSLYAGAVRWRDYEVPAVAGVLGNIIRKDRVWIPGSFHGPFESIFGWDPQKRLVSCEAVSLLDLDEEERQALADRGVNTLVKNGQGDTFVYSNRSRSKNAKYWFADKVRAADIVGHCVHEYFRLNLPGTINNTWVQAIYCDEIKQHVMRTVLHGVPGADLEVDIIPSTQPGKCSVNVELTLGDYVQSVTLYETLK